MIRQLLNKKILDNKYVVILYLLLLIALSQYVNYCLIKWDGSSHFSDTQIMHSYKFFSALNNNNSHREQAFSNPYPPLVYFVNSIYYSVYGFSMETAQHSVAVFGVIFILAMYGIGSELGGRIGGICVSSLAAGSPQVVNYMHRNYLDFPQTALTALAFYLLLKSNSYRNTMFSFLFAIALSLAVLTKWSSLFFIGLAVIWFIIPHIFRSKRSAVITVFSAGFIYFIISKAKAVFIPQMDLSHLSKWFNLYTTDLLIPSLIVLIISFVAEKLIKKDSTYTTDGSINCLNFLRVFIVCTVITGLWFYISAPNIAVKLQNDLVWRRFPESNIQYFLHSLKTYFNFAPFLIVAGIIGLFTIKDERYKKAVFLVSLFFSFYVCWKIAFANARYILSFLIIAAALGGYWVAYTGKLRKPLTLIIAALSIFSLCGWVMPKPSEKECYTTIQHDLLTHEGWRKPILTKLFTPETPTVEIFDYEIAISEVVKGFPQNNRYSYLLLDTDQSKHGFPFMGDELEVECAKRGKRILYFETHRDEELVRILKEHKESARSRALRFEILILTYPDKPKDSLFKNLDLLFQGYSKREKSWNRPLNTRMIQIIYEKNL